MASDVDAAMAVQADRDLLSAAVGNLLQNAFKFTRRGTVVSLAAYAKADRVRIEVRDCCGGLPPGDPENLFKAFKQSSADKSGLGLGLAISRRSVEANHGTLTAHDRPGEGCVFIIDLPRFTLPALVRDHAHYERGAGAAIRVERLTGDAICPASAWCRFLS